MPLLNQLRVFCGVVLLASVLDLCKQSATQVRAQPTGTKVVLSNDDGWATANIRALYTALTDEGYNVVLSAPAENKSGSGSLDLPPLLPVIGGCEFDSCPAGSPPTGYNVSDPRLNYVNSFPATSTRLGITDFGPAFFDGGKPDIVVTGPNAGTNLGIINELSGTVGAATIAAFNFGIPAVAISGVYDTQASYTTLSETSDSTTAATVYAELSTDLLAALLAPGFSESNPILPHKTILNVNYPDPSNSDGRCTSSGNFQFVLTRAVGAIPLLTPADVSTCGSTRLPTESDIVWRTDGCFASVTVLDAVTKLDVGADTQQAVLDRLNGFLSCS
ncbi:hypothetical protein ACEPAI_1684 [Sanghuangporus weigelae]